jgi:hypothetical protein
MLCFHHSFQWRHMFWRALRLELSIVMGTPVTDAASGPAKERGNANEAVLQTADV